MANDIKLVRIILYSKEYGEVNEVIFLSILRIASVKKLRNYGIENNIIDKTWSYENFNTILHTITRVIIISRFDN